MTSTQPLFLPGTQPGTCTIVMAPMFAACASPWAAAACAGSRHDTHTCTGCMEQSGDDCVGRAAGLLHTSCSLAAWPLSLQRRRRKSRISRMQPSAACCLMLSAVRTPIGSSFSAVFTTVPTVSCADTCCMLRGMGCFGKLPPAGTCM